MIKLTEVTFRYKNEAEPVIAGASCLISSEGITAVVGGSGVGKSTLLALMAGIYTVGDPAVGDLTGRISVDGLEPNELRGAHVISWVPQVAALLDHLTIHDNIMLPLKIGDGLKDAEDRYSNILDELKMEGEGKRRPRQLSGGMKTRVSLARALVSEPRYLFLDEPFASLDFGNRWNIYGIIERERRAPGFCTLMTTHNVPEAMLLADRVIVMSRLNGRTTLEEELNPRMSLVEGAVDDCLAEARRRARSIESKVFRGYY